MQIVRHLATNSSIRVKHYFLLFIESALILLQTVPTHIDIDVLKKKLLEDIDGVLAVHDFHVWQLTGDKIIASAHIRCINLSEYMKVSRFFTFFIKKVIVSQRNVNQISYISILQFGKTMGWAIEEKWSFPWIGALILKLSKSFSYSIFGS